MCCSFNSTVFAASTDIGIEDLVINENYYSMGQLQDMLLAYFEKENIEIELGTPDFLEYALDQLMYGSDEKLAELDDYELILDYLAHYKIAYEDYLFSEEESEIPFYEGNFSKVRQLGKLEMILLS